MEKRKYCELLNSEGEKFSKSGDFCRRDSTRSNFLGLSRILAAKIFYKSKKHFITLNGLLVEVLSGLDGRRVGPLGGFALGITSKSKTGLFQLLPHEGGLLTLSTLGTCAR